MDSDKNRQTDFYDEWFSSFDRANLLQLQRAASILEAMVRIGLHEPRIIDLGCGPGWLANILGTFGPTLGVDLSGEAIKVARQRFPIASFEAADIFNWDYPRESFDLVVSQEVLEHVEDQPRYLEIAHGLLKPGGYLILTTPNARTMMAMSPEERIRWTNQPLERWLTRRELNQMLVKRFKVVSDTTIVKGMGSKGSYKLMNSTRLQSVVSNLGMRKLFGNLYSRLDYGLHLLAVAQRVATR